MVQFLPRALEKLAPAYDYLVATLFNTVEVVAAVAACHPGLATGYFVQDYEADFDGLSERQRREALASVRGFRSRGRSGFLMQL